MVYFSINSNSEAECTLRETFAATFNTARDRLRNIYLAFQEVGVAIILITSVNWQLLKHFAHITFDECIVCS